MKKMGKGLEKQNEKMQILFYFFIIVHRSIIDVLCTKCVQHQHEDERKEIDRERERKV